MSTHPHRADPRDLRRRLVDLAARQAGYFTAADARSVGYSYQAQKFHADHGNWLRVERAMFRLPSWPAGEHDDLVRWSLWARGRAVVSHETAMRVHDLGDVNPARVHLTVPPGFRATAPGVRLHRGVLPVADVSSYEGFRVTTPERTLADVAAAEALAQDGLETAVEDALRIGLTTERRLVRAAEAMGDRAALRVERALAAVRAAAR